MVCRDRNRIAIQSDILGAGALGINNILCLSGDHQKFGDHPRAKNVFDIDSIQLINTVKTLRDDGKFLGERRSRGSRFYLLGRRRIRLRILLRSGRRGWGRRYGRGVNLYRRSVSTTLSGFRSGWRWCETEGCTRSVRYWRG